MTIASGLARFPKINSTLSFVRKFVYWGKIDNFSITDRINSCRLLGKTSKSIYNLQPTVGNNLDTDEVCLFVRDLMWSLSIFVTAD